jgi:general secretion pathway protein B
VPLFQELPPEVRQSLPALEINGHVYSDDPSDRFVFINWKPYREGDRLGAAEGPVLERITPEGVVVDFGSVRARVPVLP